MAKAKAKKRKKKVEPGSRGLTPGEAAGAPPPAKVEALCDEVEEDGGRVVGAFRDPLGGAWQVLVVLPVAKVQPTPFQRDLSEAHKKRLAGCIDKLDRFLDPIIVVRRDDGVYWTPNGHHRLAATRDLGGRSITALLVPEAEMAYEILALNTEKAHNLRERSLEVIRMARDLAEVDPASEESYAAIFEEPTLLTLGICYERKARFSGSVYNPVLKKVDAFLSAKLPAAIATREKRADLLFELEEAVVAAVDTLKGRGFESPYLKNFVVARIDPLRFKRDAKAEFEETLEKMIASARGFDAEKVKPAQLAKTGGPAGD